MGDDPPYLMVGTEVSAKYKGAFCEAKIRKVVRVVKCRVTFKAGLGSATIPDDHIKGDLRVGAVVEAKHPEKNQFVEATINKIQDSSQYTVVFDDGDITTLRRSALCLKSGRHFNESETLDQLPLTHPEHFSNPVVGGRRGVRRRVANNDDNEDESSDEEDVTTKKGRKKANKEADMGKVVCVESTDKKKNSKDSWFPALIVNPSAQDTVKIRTKDEYLVRSFRDGRYYTVPKKEISEFSKDSVNKAEHSSNMLRAACEKAVQYLEKDELPPHWDREVLFGHANSGEVSDEALSESSSSEDDSHEDKDRFVAQLYKFMDDRGTPIGKVPALGGKDLDLYKLYQVVMSKGGYNKVCNAGQWKAVTVKMGYGVSPAMVTVNYLKQWYKKLLHNFEDFYRKLGPLDSMSSSSTSGSKSRSNRSLFRADRSAKEVKKEEVKDEEDKKSVGSAQGASSSIAGESPEEIDAETESVYSEKLGSEKSEEPRRSRSRQDSRVKKDTEDVPEKKGKRGSKKKELERDKERENSRTPVSASPSPAPSTKRGSVGGGGRGKKKKESTAEPEVKSEQEESHDHIDKSVKIQVGDKVQVYYGPKSKGNVTYKAKVIDVDESGSVHKYLVHYTGWNTRYDEWIERYRIASLSPGKEGNEDASEADSNGNGSSTSKPAAQKKEVKKKGRPSGGQTKRGPGSRKSQPSETEKPRRRRTRKKSEQDAPSGSGSDADSSDSDDKPPVIVSTPSSVSSTASSSAPVRPGKTASQKSDQVREEDENSSSSSAGGVAAAPKKSDAAGNANAGGDISGTSAGSSAIDLAQIRSEMKGLDKLVKMSQQSASSPSPTTIPRASSPVPAASVCVPQTDIKLDVYEFQEDASDAPKLKIFQPTRSPDRKDDHDRKEEDKKSATEADNTTGSRPGTPSKTNLGTQREEQLKKEKKKKDKDDEPPVYSPIKIPKPLLSAKEAAKGFTSSPTSAFSSTRAAAPSLQPSFAVEGKTNLRMQTPAIHTPTQPVRQRAVISPYPPPLIPSGSSKPTVAAPVSSSIASSPPMPSLTQRPTLTSPPHQPPAPHLHPQFQQVRSASPRTIPSPPFVPVNAPPLPPAPTLQPAAAAHKPQEPNKGFVSRQQELFPHLAQQASKSLQPGAPKVSVPSVSMTPLSTTHSSSSASIVSSSSAGLQPGLHIPGKEPSRPPVALSMAPGTPGFGLPMTKKSPVKRKQPSKDKTPKSPPSLMVPGGSAARMDQSHLPPKKKAKKVITKNIIDPFKSEQDQKPPQFNDEAGGADSPTKKPRKPAKKRLLPPTSPGDVPGLYSPNRDNKSPNKSPTKSVKKKPKMLDMPGPPQLVPAKGPKVAPPVSYSAVSIGQASLPQASLPTGSFALMSQTSSVDPQSDAKPPTAFVQHPVRPLPPRPVATLGNFSVMKMQDDKASAPTLTPSGLPRVMANVDIGAKLAEQPAITATKFTTSYPLPGQSKPQPSASMPTATSSGYVRIPNRFDPSQPVVLATVTPTVSTPQKPITVVPLRPVVSAAPMHRFPGEVNEAAKPVSAPVLFACETRAEPKNKPVVVVPVPKASPPSVSSLSSIPVIKIPEVKDEKGNWRMDDSDVPVCLVMKEDTTTSRPSIIVKDEAEDEDIKPTDLSMSGTSSSSAGPTKEAESREEAKEEDESCNSLLCEEEIPGSPPPGADSSFFGMDEENSASGTPVKKEDRAPSPEPQRKYEHSFTSSSDSWKDRKGDERPGRSKSPKNGPPTESNQPKKPDDSHDRALPGNSGGNHNRERQQVPLAFGNSHQQNLQHVIDNTPPTTPESSSISSGSPRVDGGRVSPSNDNPSSSKSKDSSDLDSNDKMAELNEDCSSSDAGRKYVKESPQKKRSSDIGRNPGNISPPAKRRRVQRRKSPDEMRSYGYRGRGTTSGRKGNDKDSDHGKSQPPPPPVNLTRPPVSKKFNLIPDLDETMDTESRIQALQQALQTIKEKYQEVKSELSSEERRLKRYKRRLKDREKEKKTVKSA